MFKIREAVNEDYSQLLGLYKELQEYRLQQEPEYFLETDIPFPVETFNSLLADEQAKLYIVEKSGNLLGFTVFKIRWFEETPARKSYYYLEIEELYVSEKSKRAGIVQHLFEKVKRFGERHGLEEIQLNLWEFDDETIDYYQERLRLTPKIREFVFRL